MRTLEQQIASKCRHFTGTSNVTCDKGVVYSEVRDLSKEGAREKYPCFKEGECLKCEYRSFYTPEEVKQLVEDIELHSDRAMVAVVAAKADAKEKGLVKGKGGQSKVKCPNCEDGMISYSVAAINGHMWARCSTKDCCAWME